MILDHQPPIPGGRLQSNPRACRNAQRGGVTAVLTVYGLHALLVCRICLLVFTHSNP